MPAISIIMPVRNTERYIAAAVQSVLAQQDADFELIVVDDGSTDRSIKLVEQVADQRVRIIPGPCRGIPAAVNAGLAAARGAFLARCDGDDLYPPGRLRRQLAWLRMNPAFGTVCGTFAVASRRGRVLAEVDCGPLPPDGREITGEVRQGRLTASLNTCMWRCALAEQLGGFRDFFLSGSDVDYQLRLGEICRTWLLPHREYIYRLHENSITHRLEDERRLFYQETARQMQVQRRQSGCDDIERGRPPSLPGRAASRSTPPLISAGSALNGRAGGRPVRTDRQEAAMQHGRTADERAVRSHVANPHARAASHLQGIVLGHAWREHRRGRRLSALRAGVTALATGPRELTVWRSVAALLVKRPGRE